MAASRKVGLIAVGVDKTNVLPTLKGAASGAGKRCVDGGRLGPKLAGLFAGQPDG